MKRVLMTSLAVALLVGAVSVTSGCSGSKGRYFSTTRENEPHAFRNRIHNPADYRYASANHQ